MFILTLVVFAVISLDIAVGLCDLFYALMAFPTMLTLILLRSKVREETDRYYGAVCEKPAEGSEEKTEELITSR